MIDAQYISLATWRKNGAEVRTPVWFVVADESSLYCFSAGDAGKVKRLRNSPRAAVASCDARGGSLGDWHAAEAYPVDSLSECKRAYRMLIYKYGWQMRLANLFSRIMGRINKRQVIRIELEVGE